MLTVEGLVCMVSGITGVSLWCCVAAGYTCCCGCLHGVFGRIGDVLETSILNVWDVSVY